MSPPDESSFTNDIKIVLQSARLQILVILILQANNFVHQKGDLQLTHKQKKVCMCVCMYVCVYVCVNVCVYICMYVCMYVSLNLIFLCPCQPTFSENTNLGLKFCVRMKAIIQQPLPLLRDCPMADINSGLSYEVFFPQGGWIFKNELLYSQNGVASIHGSSGLL